MGNKDNVLWEKHRMCLPELRKRAIHRCRHCKFYVTIQGKAENRPGCVINIKAYSSLAKRVPRVISVYEIIKRVGLEGLDKCLQCNPEAQSCGRFELRS